MQISHDIHIHTHLSVCAPDKTGTIAHYYKVAKELGLKKIGISDHFWDEHIPATHDFYYNQNFPHVEQIKKEIADTPNPDGIEIHFGCECEYDYAHRDIAITAEVAEKFEHILVPNSHTHMIMPKDCYHPYEKHVDFMIQAFWDIINSPNSKYVTAIAHPFEAVCCPYNNNILINMISDDTFKRMFDAAANKGIAFEINMAGNRNWTLEQMLASPKVRMYRLAKECGCLFTFGSDAHCDREHKGYEKTDELAAALGITEKDLHPYVR